MEEELERTVPGSESGVVAAVVSVDSSPFSGDVVHSSRSSGPA